MAPSSKKLYLEELARIQDRIHSLFEQALLPAEYDDRGGLPGTWAPAVDVLETASSFLLFAELPGVRREDIQLQVRDRWLEISGRRQPLGESRNFLRMERSYGPFRRAFELSSPIDGDGIVAAFERGVLNVLVPKRKGGKAVPIEEKS
jgi:HSP20 family protein